MSSTILSPTPLEVRHVASNPSITLLTPSPSTRTSHPSLTPTRRASPQPLQVLPGRLPSSRPSSIPSSPTSIRSSSSAIFERDIEQISLSTSPSRPDPHHISRAITHEAVDGSVPSVLDQAVSVLTQSDGTSRSPQEEVSVITPAPPAVSGLGSPVPTGSSLYASTSGIASPVFVASRSPSPTGTHASITNANAASGSPKSGTRPLLNERRTDSLPVAPGAFPSSSVGPAPLVSGSPSQGPAVLPSVASSSPSPRPQKANSLPAPDDPFQSAGNKRLSFVSYHDLLLSTPVSATSLSSLTSPSTNEPPPHIPPILQPHPSISVGGISPVGSMNRESLWGKEEGGEWEREGFGRGLDERLDELLHSDANSTVAKAS